MSIKNKKITYLRTWPTNIGNAFIDIGAIECFKKAIPNVEIYDEGGLGRRYCNRYINKNQEFYMKYAHLCSLLRNFINTNKQRSISKRHFEKIFLDQNKSVKNFFDISLYLRTEYVIISGCILTYQLGLFYSTLMNFKKRNIKIIFNAVGGSDYSQSEVETIREFLEDIKPYAFISRDRESFKKYHDLADHSYDGIDAAFFISDCYKPPKLQLPEYLVLNFDKIEEPHINSDCDLIIRTSHYVCPLNENTLRKIYRKFNLMVSDNPKDYFTLYANAKEVHSDRVHACIATLTYGKPCKLYYKTKRSYLFDRMGLEQIREKLTKLNPKSIEKEKNEQVKFIKEII